MSASSLRKGGPIGQGQASGTKATENAMLQNKHARELPAHNSATNTLTKHVNSNKGFGALGGKGHGGAT